MMTTKRAIKPEDKEEKRTRILQAADDILRSAPLHAVSMAEVAQKAGIAKGTLYLYFSSREQLFLGVYESHFLAWVHRFSQALAGIERPMPPLRFAGALLDACRAVPRFVTLTGLLHPLIEDQMSEEDILAFKARSVELYGLVVELIARALGIEDRRSADDLTRDILALLVGYAQMATPDDRAAAMRKMGAERLVVAFERDFSRAVRLLVEATLTRL